MNIIAPKDTSVRTIIRPIDNEIIQQLVSKCLKIKKNDVYDNVYSNFYDTVYTAGDMSLSEIKMQSYLQSMMNSKGGLRTEEQGEEYRWIYVNENFIGTTAYRYYFAPNPNNMYNIVQSLTKEFTTGDIPVKFKYQLSGKKDDCDRIIVYSDFEHREEIENAISRVYHSNQHLFDGAERALPWIYESSVPNVYFAPETPGFSYGVKFAMTMIQAKEIFCYMYGITDSNNKLKLSGDDAKQAIDYMETIITSLLFRNGLLLSKDRRVLSVKDHINTTYNYQTGELTNYCDNQEGHHSVVFHQNGDGKNALFNNFYNVSKIKSGIGMDVEHLTLEERKRKLNEAIFKDYYAYKNNQQLNNHRKL